jgi:CheY-like chemotaxis protein
MKRKRILMVVDDDPDDLELLVEALLTVEPTLGILTAHSGTDCLDQLNALDTPDLPALLVLDFNLYDMNAADLLAKMSLHERFDSLTKIVWSTSDLHQYRDKCNEKGAKHYLKKPNTYPQVVEMARRIVSHLD